VPGPAPPGDPCLLPSARGRHSPALENPVPVRDRCSDSLHRCARDRAERIVCPGTRGGKTQLVDDSGDTRNAGRLRHRNDCLPPGRHRRRRPRTARASSRTLHSSLSPALASDAGPGPIGGNRRRPSIPIESGRARLPEAADIRSHEWRRAVELARVFRERAACVACGTVGTEPQVIVSDGPFCAPLKCLKSGSSSMLDRSSPGGCPLAVGEDRARRGDRIRQLVERRKTRGRDGPHGMTGCFGAGRQRRGENWAHHFAESSRDTT
jgi:hypothetical protein